MHITEHDLEWNLPPERGWAYIHAADLLGGARMRWPTPEHNADHEELQRIRSWAASRR